MIRIPDQGRFELRFMDGSVNPYLLQAGIIAAGLEGINKRNLRLHVGNGLETLPK